MDLGSLLTTNKITKSVRLPAHDMPHYASIFPFLTLHIRQINKRKNHITPILITNKNFCLSYDCPYGWI